MRISARSDYAVRAMTELAARHGAPWTRAEILAEAQDVPLPFLLWILKDLRDAGLVVSKRGSVGGYHLARAASQITVADVMRAVDGPLTSVAGTLLEDVECTGAAAAVRDTWLALAASIGRVLDGVSLADLDRGRLPSEILELLYAPPGGAGSPGD